MTIYRTARSVLAFCLVMFVGSALWAPVASGGTGPTLGRYGTSNMDLDISGGEYGNSCVGPIQQTSGAKTYHFTICEQNDTQNIYWALRIDQGLSPGFDSPAFWFDNNDDGKIAAGDPAGGCAADPAPVEDAFSYSASSSGVYDDLYTCFTPGVGFSVGGDAEYNGYGGCQPNGANTEQTCEFQKPLKSADSDDFSLNPGDKVGWCFTWNDRSNTTDAIGNVAGDLQYPVNCWLDKTNHHDSLHGDASAYANAGIHSELEVEVAAVSGRILNYLATCKFCPPDPTKVLKEEAQAAIKALSAGDRAGAVKALRSFKASVQRFARKRRFPRSRASVLAGRVAQLIFQIQNPPVARAFPPPPGPPPRASKFIVSAAGNRIQR